MNVLVSTMTIVMKQIHAILRVGMFLVGHLEVPLHGFVVILRHSLTALVQHADMGLGGDVTSGGGFEEPTGGDRRIL